ncbi:hypothetical protein PHYSODRAFT_532888 [Phytophthora sojae]|uniref:Uncharacterized protein n=1 Tax=Phytophthora sojae (strain P6497) TaxID=1094619 RepID=G5AEX8_PHYSP|nr:hypothetical protein PHYSODRAFT_532888 [Phytophthora sojae]EGZ05768.1 hypothetical protein PHYSODRAFT_532888 [Phytophthora sojae]|eukprot:XP_009538629.1 hypothetical protein PHYSODRAFT_532888 [Phytophthora sojae]
MVKDTQVPFAGLKFNENPNDFQRCKDAVVAHLVSKTNSRKVSEIQAGRASPRHGFQDLLLRPAHIADPGPDATDDARNQHEYEVALLDEVDSYIRDMFNRTLPHTYMNQLSTPLSAQTVAAFWAQLEKLRNMRNRLNRQGQETLRVHLLPSQLMIGKVLAMLPGHLWGPSITFSQEEIFTQHS